MCIRDRSTGTVRSNSMGGQISIHCRNETEHPVSVSHGWPQDGGFKFEAWGVCPPHATCRCDGVRGLSRPKAGSSDPQILCVRDHPDSVQSDLFDHSPALSLDDVPCNRRRCYLFYEMGHSGGSGLEAELARDIREGSNHCYLVVVRENHVELGGKRWLESEDPDVLGARGPPSREGLRDINRRVGETLAAAAGSTEQLQVDEGRFKTPQ
eukprot:TRINITY_DN28064_c0_g1_i2.p1 TRINITY_DN28064_c0_g1~~TRINITY_DN28064_c0_g1_i2.p1  ORF type:complete len:210 (-),score=30.61 TRINITY_DN28064_c0_g1_i2:114-743(-)